LAYRVYPKIFLSDLSEYNNVIWLKQENFWNIAARSITR